MIDLKNLTFPVDYKFVNLFEKVLLNKFPEMNLIYDNFDHLSIAYELQAFDFFVEILENYDLKSIIHIDSVNYSVSKTLYNRLEINKDFNTLNSSKEALSFLEKATFVASYLQKTHDDSKKDSKNDGKEYAFLNVPDELKNEIDYTERHYEFHQYFWRLPFAVIIRSKSEKE